MTTTPTSGAADRAIENCPELNMGNYDEVDVERLNDWAIRANDEIDRLHTLAAGQATAAQAAPHRPHPAVLLPDLFHVDGKIWSAILDWRDAKRGEDALRKASELERVLVDQLRAFADATHALRASHGQAPADAKALAEADRRAGEAERILATCKENVTRFEQVRSRMKYQWGAEQRVSFDEVWDEALALKKAAQAAPQAADSVQDDAAREAIEKVLALFPFNALIQKFSVNNGPCLTADNDDEFYSVKRVLAFLTEIKTTLDAARKQGANHDR